MEYFKELGLTENEGKVYEALLRHEKIGSGEISRESGVSYSKIYNVLDSLTAKGLVEVIPEKTKKFVASSPENLIKLIEEKKGILEQAREKAEAMKKVYENQGENPVTMGLGRKGFYKIVKQLSEPEKYEYSIKWTSEAKSEWLRYFEELKGKGVDLRTLSRYDEETKKDVDEWLKIKKNLRRLENEGVAMSIIDDKEVMISLIRSNVTLLVKDKAFTKIMKKMFLETYNNAEKIK